MKSKNSLRMKPEIVLPESKNPRVPAAVRPFRTVLPIQIRFNDIDLLGHVNNEMYFAYMDLAKLRYFQELAPGRFDWRAINAVVANVNCDFYAPTTIDEHICVVTVITHIGESSFRLEQRVVDVDDGEVKCIGRTVMVAIDIKTGAATPLDPEWVKAVEEAEGGGYDR